MSPGGGYLTALWQPDEHVWSTATQLVAGVAFMHQHDVAHQDIKPAKVLIPPAVAVFQSSTSASRYLSIVPGAKFVTWLVRSI